jgi:hypothetical protein
MIVYLLTRMTTATDIQEQRRTFEGLLHRYPPEQAEAALGEVLAARTPSRK